MQTQGYQIAKANDSWR